ncbi:MAG: hypothetical protein PHD04_04515 [Candidatus Pacebacteria bacterium]|nr:hypothetical protein [Candidatus Paceibacterota bacterium]
MQLNIIEKVKQLYKENPSELFYRALSSLLSMFIVPHIVFLIFIVYMSHNNFFSYDFFIDGLFGMKLFFSVVVISILFMAAYTTSGMIGIIGKKKFKDWWGVYLTNCSVILILILLALSEHISWTYFLYIMVILTTISIHVALLIYRSLRTQFFSLLIISITIPFITIIFASETSRILSIGLKAFGIGGNEKVEIKIDENRMDKGELLLLTPANIYVKPYDRNGTKIYSFDSIESLYVGKDINLTIPTK